MPRLLVLMLTISGLAACGETTAPGATSPGISTGAIATPAGATDTPLPEPTATPSFAPAGPGQLNIDRVMAAVAEQYPPQAHGATVTTTCDQSGVITASPGTTFSCAFTDSAGRSGMLTVTITGTHGEFTWSIGPAPAPTP